MKSTPNLSSLIPWYRVVALITGKEPTTQSVPYKSQCPKCKGPHLTFQCTTGGGEWHHCQGCGFAGDNIEYAANAWGLSIPATIAQLSTQLNNRQLNANRTAIDTYVNEVVKVRQSNNVFWAACKKQYSSTVSIRDAREYFGLPEPAENTRWSDLVSEHIGGMNRTALADYFPVLCRSKESMFGYKSWNGCIVIPTWDLPGRIASFLFMTIVNHHGAMLLDKPVLPGLLPGTTGAMFLPAFKAKSDYLVVTDNVHCGVRLWSERMSKKEGPIPLVVLPPGASPSVLLTRMAASRKMLVWGEKPQEAAVVRLAAKLGVGASVSISPVTPRHMIAQEGHQRWLDNFVSRKVLWQDYLETKLLDMSFEEVVDYLDTLTLPDEQLRAFANGCTSRARTAVFEAIGRVPDKSVRFRDKTIIESASGWSLLDSGETVSEAVIKLKSVAHKTRDDSVWYSGEIVFQNEVIPFAAPKRVVETKTGDWLARTLVAAGKTVPIIDPSWERYLCQISLLFGKPSVVTSPDKIGWDARNVGFAFPNFFISTNGSAAAKTSVADADAPCLGFRLPTGLTQLEMSPIGALKDDAKVVWSLATYVLASAIADVFSRPMPNLVICGMGASSAKALLTHLGVVPEVKGREDAWPTFAKRTRATTWEELLPSKGKVCFADEVEAYSMHLQGWVRLLVPDSFDIPAELAQGLPRLIPEALVEFGKQGRDRRVDLTDPLLIARSILSNLAYDRDGFTGWPIKDMYFDYVLSLPNDDLATCRSVVGLLHSAIQDNEIEYERAGYRLKKHSTNWSTVYSEGKIWIPQDGIIAYTRLKKLPHPPIAKIDLAFNSFPDKYFGKKKLDGKEGWLVDEAWINER